MESMEIIVQMQENTQVSSNSGMLTMTYQMIHFSERELACKHCGLSGCTDDLKRALDVFRELLNQPVIVHDAYRCPQHNAAVSLVAKSQHPEGTAADISVSGLTLQEMYDAAKRVDAFAA